MASETAQQETGIERGSSAAAPAAKPAATSVEPPDDVLLTYISDGDRESLGLLFRRYARIVRGVAYRVLRDASEADDLLQDIFLLIHRHASQFNPSRGSVRFWILQMTYRRAISRRRYLDARHFYRRLDLDEVAESIPDAASQTARYEDSIDGRLGHGALADMLAQLSENQRQTLHLHLVEGYTFEEIAVKLSQTRGNIKNHYFRGLEKLRRQLFVHQHLRDQSAV